MSIPTQPFLLRVDPRVTGLTTTAPSRGNSTGVNLGLSWTGSFNWISPKLRKLSCTLGVDRSDYSFEEKARTNDFAETTTRVRVDLRHPIGIGREAAEQGVAASREHRARCARARPRAPLPLIRRCAARVASLPPWRGMQSRNVNGSAGFSEILLLTPTACLDDASCAMRTPRSTRPRQPSTTNKATV